MTLRKLPLRRQLDLLLVLVTFSFTSGAWLALEGLRCQETRWYFHAFVFLLSGLAFTLARRKIARDARGAVE